MRVLLVAAAVVVSMLAVPVSPESAWGAAHHVSELSVRPTELTDAGNPRGDTLLAQERRDELDVPTMPAGCFGPGQGSSDPDRPCHLTSFRKDRPTVVLWGDSHAWQMIPAVTEAAKGTGVNLVSFVAGNCPPMAVRHATPSGVCERSNAAALAFVTRLHDDGREVKALLGSNWSDFRIAYRRLMLESVGLRTDYERYKKRMTRLGHEGTPALFTRLGELGVPVEVIAQAATVPAVNPVCDAGEEPYRCDVARWRALPEEGRTTTWLRGQLRKITGPHRIVETKSAYCTALVCHGELDGITTFVDDLHLSATRTRALAPAFTTTFTSMKAPT